MKLCTLAIFALIAGLALPVWAQQDATKAPDKGASLQEKVKQDPNNAKLIIEYVNTMLGKINSRMRQDPDAALKKLDELKASLDSLEPDAPKAKNLVRSAKSFTDRFRRKIELQKTSLEELVKNLKENPTDVKAISLYAAKISQEAGTVVRSAPEKAEKLLEEAKQLLASVREKGKDNEDVAKAIDRAEKGWAGLTRLIASAKKLKELIGKDAAPLTVDTWVNGSPLTDEDLKGKVVLLDFWAVWCGPCVSTFPHLIEWNEEYADKGLAIIGMTNYYGMVWDEEKKSYKRADGPSEDSEANEREMLEKFAKLHKLEHRIAVSKERTMAEFYGVTGIPHVVIIDRHGKIRLIKVGSGPANTEAIQKMLEELLAEKV